ncbi:metallophosphoesterase family protein [Conexibacter sp. JD483]|uniref:metallophosphoesterase family protein n=1 Tax=unclassified Conexibacter TaxID=2627773 RepID=UPI0027264394|nr:MULTISPECIES: metallophosphoesterase family protein [unclassified Conexibacter]MDO8185162.1 metallophosphoesterase family protein [Conexibacter sp. CPCC 205706]MDO8196872.1 metallophosphoesterase family protein [Conexibacter sp. CPCC 205762]MDR9368648.1 metallophosphoesterase family protein [Conexibacter sp. JD483]
MRLAIVSDTHMPKVERTLPAACVAELRAADLIVHAGDFVRAPVLEQLRSYGEVAAVHGNVDEPALRAELPAVLELELRAAGAGAGAAPVRLAIVHDAGPRVGRMARMRRRFPHADAVVFGHSHIPLHEVSDDDGFQLFNPGSPTERRRAPRHTMGVARIAAGRIGFELVTVG